MLKKKLNEQADALPSFEINGSDFYQLGFVKYLNPNFSQISRDNNWEEGTDIYIFDFPKSKFNEEWFRKIQSFLEDSNSHGVEGNSGGYTYKTRYEISDVGDIYRLTVTHGVTQDI